MPDDMPHWMLPTIDGRVLVTSATACVATAVVFGLVPALHSSSSKLAGRVREGGRGVGRGIRTRRLTTLFLVVQFALAMIFLAHVALTIRSARAIARRDPPIDMSRLLTASISLPGRVYKRPPTGSGSTGHLKVASCRSPTWSLLRSPRRCRSRMRPTEPFEIEGRTAPANSSEEARIVSIGSKYFATLGVPLLRGREFTTADGEPGREAVIVNQRFVELYFTQGDTIGRRVRMKGDGAEDASSWATIVGVSQNVRQLAAPDPEPVIYAPYVAAPPAAASMMLRGRADAGALAGPLREAVRELDPDLPLYHMWTLERAVAEADWNARVSNLLITIITCVAITLASVGLYTLTAHALALRTQEMGVRIALGASAGRVVWLLMRLAVAQLAAGLAIGVAAVLGWSRIFPDGGHGARLTDVQGLTLAGALLVILGLVGSMVPALRASRLNPATALRYE